MVKGLQRSLARGPKARNPVNKLHVKIDDTFSITGQTSTAKYATLVIGDVPEGNILFLGAVAYVQVNGPGSSANLTNDFEGDYAIGSAPTADVTLNGSEVNIIPSTQLAAASNEVGAVTRAVNATAAVLDNTDGSLELNLNIVIDADEVTNGQTVAFTVTGDLWLSYIVLGDD
jgi:hypothetical protein